MIPAGDRGDTHLDIHLPLGVGSLNGQDPIPVCRAGSRVVALNGLRELGMLDNHAVPDGAWCSSTLDLILAAGPLVWASLRQRLIDVINDPSAVDRIASVSAPLDSVRMVLPFTVADYVDFYSSLHHATNVGRIFRPNGEPLLPNWRHLPVGYHGRSASIDVSESDVHRPKGLRLIDGSLEFGPSVALDYELEVGFVVGVGNQGEPVPTADFADHVFGVCLVNDWSARDIQSFEYQPLGPFLGKSFHTSISPWITPLAAFDPYRLQPPEPDVDLAGYLQSPDRWALDIDLNVAIESAEMRAEGLEPMIVSKASFADMAWTPDQQLAHLTVNGATVRTGDFYASGTVSGPKPGGEGSLLERTIGATRPLQLPDGSSRTYLVDGDRVVLRGQTRQHGNGSPGFDLGEVSGTVVAPRLNHDVEES